MPANTDDAHALTARIRTRMAEAREKVFGPSRLERENVELREKVTALTVAVHVLSARVNEQRADDYHRGFEAGLAAGAAEALAGIAMVEVK